MIKMTNNHVGNFGPILTVILNVILLVFEYVGLITLSDKLKSGANGVATL